MLISLIAIGASGVIGGLERSLKTEIPPDARRWARSWDGARKVVNEELTHLLEKTDWPEGSPFLKLNRWYKSCMDLETVNKLGAAPLRPMLDKIDAIQTLEDLQDFLVEVQGRAHRAFGRIIDQALIKRELIEKLVLVSAILADVNTVSVMKGTSSKADSFFCF